MRTKSTWKGYRDSILVEVLQGFDGERDFMLNYIERVVESGGAEMAIQAARNFRSLRKRGLTVRKIDGLIATRCIEEGYYLLHNDGGFDPFVKYLGLRLA